MANTKRQQARESESHINTRQDRNLFVTDGGTWTWDQGSGTLSWSGTVGIGRGGIAANTVLAGTITGVTAAGQAVYVDVSRTAGGVLAFQSGGALLNDAAHSTDVRVVIGSRGVDGKFYFRNGTVMSDGDSKLFGMLNTATDRVDITADGLALQSVGFTYLQAANQLAVYVGGILQTLTVDYVEASASTITFQPASIPSAGEAISFVNLIGGQGPAATGTVTLQDAWSVGNDIDVSSGGPVIAKSSIPGDVAYAVQYDPGGGFVDTLQVGAEHGSILAGVSTGVGGYAFFTSDKSGDNWILAPDDTVVGKDALLVGGSSGKGLRVTDAGLLEFGQYVGSYPGGSWSGNGGMQWSVYVGTLSAAAPTYIATGLTGILGVSFAVLDGVTGLVICQDVSTGSGPSKRYGISFDPVTGNIQIAGFVDGSGTPGTDVDGEAYTLIVFHQG